MRTRSSFAVGSVESTPSERACSSSAAVGPDEDSTVGMKSDQQLVGVAGDGRVRRVQQPEAALARRVLARRGKVDVDERRVDGRPGGHAGRGRERAGRVVPAEQQRVAQQQVQQCRRAGGLGEVRLQPDAVQVGAGELGQPAQVVAAVGGVRPDPAGLGQRAVVDQRRQQRLLEVGEQPAQQVRILASRRTGRAAPAPGRAGPAASTVDGTVAPSPPRFSRLNRSSTLCAYRWWCSAEVGCRARRSSRCWCASSASPPRCGTCSAAVAQSRPASVSTRLSARRCVAAAGKASRENAVVGRIPYGCRPIFTAGSGPRPDTCLRKKSRVAATAAGPSSGFSAVCRK